MVGDRPISSKCSDTVITGANEIGFTPLGVHTNSAIPALQGYDGSLTDLMAGEPPFLAVSPEIEMHLMPSRGSPFS